MTGDDPAGRWYHEDTPRFREALAFTEAESGFLSRLIEKDYYGSLILHDLSGLFQQGLVFKGGTCLSKVHAEFFRLSEDLDFSVSLGADATGSERRLAASPIKVHLAGLPARFAWFEEVEAFTGHNQRRQYNGQFAYRSAVSGERETIRIELSLREEHLLPSERQPALTLLRDPRTGRPALDPIDVRVLSVREAYAEKIRAALTRPEPAVRDFFDIDHAVRLALLDSRDPSVIQLVAAKLAVPGNSRVDLTAGRIEIIRGQLEAHLRPVLRDRDYEAFDLDRVVSILQELAARLGGSPA